MSDLSAMNPSASGSLLVDEDSDSPLKSGRRRKGGGGAHRR